MLSNPTPPNAATLQAGDLVDEREAAKIIGLRVATLRNWRCLRKGPRYRKVGQRMVRYHRADLVAFITGNNASTGAA